MSLPLPVINLETATFECIFGRGCDGICCKPGEPPVFPDEIRLLEGEMTRILPELRPEAQAQIAANGFLAGLHANGEPKLATTSDGWCIFFNQGCALHKLGAAEGQPLRYKPMICALFPLQDNAQGEWYVRQWGVEDEEWDLFCLNPRHSNKPAAESLQSEVALLQEIAQRENRPAILPFPADAPARESA